MHYLHRQVRITILQVPIALPFCMFPLPFCMFPLPFCMFPLTFCRAGVHYFAFSILVFCPKFGSQIPIHPSGIPKAFPRHSHYSVMMPQLFTKCVYLQGKSPIMYGRNRFCSLHGFLCSSDFSTLSCTPYKLLAHVM
jgi:hypothetical protein